MHEASYYFGGLPEYLCFGFTLLNAEVSSTQNESPMRL